MERRPVSLLSFFSVVAAAAASLATSAPPPDWTLDDEVEGEVVLLPNEAETTIRVRASARATDASLSVSIALDPVPRRLEPFEKTPIVLFVGSPRKAGEPAPTGSAPLKALPAHETPVSGFERGGNGHVAEGTIDQVFEIKVAWDSPNPEDTRTYPGDGQGAEKTVVRPRAPRQPTTIRWRARVNAAGYDDKPAGAAIDVEPAP